MMLKTLSRSHVRSFATRAFLSPSSLIGSWQAPKDPKEAEAMLGELRREYAKQVKEVRKEYMREMEAMALEKQRKDEARRESLMKSVRNLRLRLQSLEPRNVTLLDNTFNKPL